MLNLKSIYYYFLSIQIILLKFIKKFISLLIIITNHYYPKHLNSFIFIPIHFYFPQLHTTKRNSFKISEIDPNVFG